MTCADAYRCVIKNLNRALRTTAVVVSHDIHETSSIADKLYIISDGRVIGEGSPEELKRGESAWVQQFMHGSPDGPVPFHYPADDLKFDVLGGSTR